MAITHTLPPAKSQEFFPIAAATVTPPPPPTSPPLPPFPFNWEAAPDFYIVELPPAFKFPLSLLSFSFENLGDISGEYPDPNNPSPSPSPSPDPECPVDRPETGMLYPRG